MVAHLKRTGRRYPCCASMNLVRLNEETRWKDLTCGLEQDDL
jgi:hypothetical protein